MTGRGSLAVKNSMIGLSPSSSFVSMLSEEFDRDCNLGFLVFFSLLVVVDDIKIFGEFGGLEDDESDFSLLCVSLGEQDAL